jgi:hypothetical protein
MTNIAAGTLSASCSLGLQSAGGMKDTYGRQILRCIFSATSIRLIWLIYILRKLWSSTSLYRAPFVCRQRSQRNSGCRYVTLRASELRLVRTPHRHRFYSRLHRNCFIVTVDYHRAWFRGFPCVLPGRPSVLPVQCRVWRHPASQTGTSTARQLAKNRYERYEMFH